MQILSAKRQKALSFMQISAFLGKMGKITTQAHNT
jgi:hypothetical protein